MPNNKESVQSPYFLETKRYFSQFLETQKGSCKEIFLILVFYYPNVASLSDILSVWKEENLSPDVKRNHLEVIIYRLRERLKTQNVPLIIRSRSGIGYVLERTDKI